VLVHATDAIVFDDHFFRNIIAGGKLDEEMATIAASNTGREIIKRVGHGSSDYSAQSSDRGDC
jgi:hypothetical protein